MASESSESVGRLRRIEETTNPQRVDEGIGRGCAMRSGSVLEPFFADRQDVGRGPMVAAVAPYPNCLRVRRMLSPRFVSIDTGVVAVGRAGKGKKRQIRSTAEADFHVKSAGSKGRATAFSQGADDADS